MSRLLVLVFAAILGASFLAGAAAVLAGGAAPAPAVDRVLADPPPESHVPAVPGGGVNTVPCPNCWT